MNYLKSLIRPLPSLFDIAISGMFAVFFIHGDDNRSLFIFFYSSFLYILSLGMKRKREYNSWPLSILALWSLANLFIHNFYLNPKSITYSWKIFNLSTEGFLYILSGCMFIKTVTQYSTNPRFCYFLAPCALTALVPGAIKAGSITWITALSVAALIYLYVSKRFKAAITLSIIAICAGIAKWSWVVFKFKSRPYAYYQLGLNMFYNPIRNDGKSIIDPGVELSPIFEKWLSAHAPAVLNIKPYLASIFGSGFSTFLNSDYKWVEFRGFQYGWVHKHCDILNLANCLGPISIVFVVAFIAQSLRTIGVRPVMIIFLAVCLTTLSHLTFFDPGKAAISLALIALTITDGIRKEQLI